MVSSDKIAELSRLLSVRANMPSRRFGRKFRALTCGASRVFGMMCEQVLWCDGGVISVAALIFKGFIVGGERIIDFGVSCSRWKCKLSTFGRSCFFIASFQFFWPIGQVWYTAPNLEINFLSLGGYEVWCAVGSPNEGITLFNTFSHRHDWWAFFNNSGLTRSRNGPT